MSASDRGENGFAPMQRLKMATRFTAVIGVIAFATMLAAAGRQTFEVASVTRNPSHSNSASMRVTTHAVRIRNVPLRQLILSSYQLRPQLLVGAPTWTDREHFDIAATPPASANRQEVFVMLQHLLEDRFKLRLHREPRALPVYVLERTNRTRLGPSLTPAPVNCLPAACEARLLPGGSFEANAAPWPMIAMWITYAADRVVIDETNLGGAFDASLRFARTTAPGGEPHDADVPDLFTAVREQLALRLRPDTRTVDVWIIDGVDRPIEN